MASFTFFFVLFAQKKPREKPEVFVCLTSNCIFHSSQSITSLIIHILHITPLATNSLFALNYIPIKTLLLIIKPIIVVSNGLQGLIQTTNVNGLDCFCLPLCRWIAAYGLTVYVYPVTFSSRQQNVNILGSNTDRNIIANVQLAYDISQSI